MFNNLARVSMPGKLKVRGLWRQENLPDANGSLSITFAPRGIVWLKSRRLKRQKKSNDEYNQNINQIVGCETAPYQNAYDG